MRYMTTREGKVSEVKLITASNDLLLILGRVEAPVQVDDSKMLHHFVVVVIPYSGFFEGKIELNLQKFSL